MKTNNAHATEILARYVVETNYEDIPIEAITHAKELIISAVGSAIGGSLTPVGKIIAKHIKENSHLQDASVIGCGFKSSVENALVANGTFAHSLEMEDVALQSGPNTVMTIIAALTLGDKLQLSGREVIESFILGYELHSAIFAGSPGITMRGWDVGTIVGTIGAAATASKQLKLNIDSAMMAIGLAASQSGGIIHHTGTMAHILEFGLSARNGVEAALLVRKGINAAKDIIEHPKGFCSIAAGKDGYDLEKITKNLGKRFFLVDDPVCIKKYPCCFRIHRAIDATLEIIEDYGLSYDSIKEIEVGINQYDDNVLKLGEPQSADDAEFSISHSLAMLILDKKLNKESFSDENVTSSRSKKAREKINVIVHHEWPAGRTESRTPVSIRLYDGTIYEKDLLRPRKPTEKELIEKYEECATDIVLSKEDKRKALELLFKLEKVANVSEVMNILRATSPQKMGGTSL